MKNHVEKILEDLEHFKDLNFVEDTKEKSVFWKVLVLLGAVICLVLILSLVFVTYPIGEILSGQITSAPLQQNILNVGSLQIIFEQGSEKQLQMWYSKEQKVEWSACLQGTKEGNIYHINTLYQPTMYTQTFNEVMFAPCSADTLIILHTHPYKSCQASSTDIETLRKTQQRNQDTLMVVMCEPARFAVYS